MEHVLRTEGITKIYGKHTVVDHVSMHVKKGDIYGFIGKNGAGKTTFMRMVAGLAAPASGSMELFGSENLECQRQRIGVLIEQPGLYGAMNARENMEIVRRSFGIAEKNAIDEMLEFVGLLDAGKKKVKHFSLGMKQRLGIAIALFRNPDFLILDEPINGLDPEGIKEMRDLFRKLNEEKQITILISSHILGELSKIATSYGIIKDGVLIEEFDAKELKSRCRRCVKLVVDDVERAAAVLEQNCHITSYDVPEPGVLRVFDGLENSGTMNRELMLAGVSLRESYLAGQDLEGYFMDLLGGEPNA
ncbi:MAG: ABC transporter ATP-binding protein [Lachnospiraceae bacterium]|jgi:ABC-2 type transport system ATP-binding protein|nr:ABC transporter ATP-binding protein [Lachnospiraceae bacterium]